MSMDTMNEPPVCPWNLAMYDMEILLTIGFFYLRFFLKNYQTIFLTVFFVEKVNDV